MPRKPDPGRREELETALADHLLAHGMRDLSLRVVAKDLGISTYPLIYHFGSKEGLVIAALAAIEERQRAMIASWLQEQPTGGIGEIVRRYWDWTVRDEMLPYHRLYFEIYGLALQNPGNFDTFLARAGAQPWTTFLRKIVRDSGVVEADLVAASIIATVAGVLLIFLTDGDSEQAAHTIDALGEDVERRSTPRDGERTTRMHTTPA